MSVRRGLSVALLGAFLPVACVPAPEEEEVPADSATLDTVAEWTAGIVERGSGADGVAVQSAMRSARHETHDRVTFEFEGDSLPGYHIEYIDRPVRQCGSGATTEIAGDGWLEIRFEPAAAHDEGGRPTVAERERAYELPIVREIELTCDFEAVVVWVVGTASPNRYRVLELGGPARLVVDIRH